MSMINFTEMQKKAICHNEGPALVAAGPGSGKTTVIVSRLLRLADEYPGAKLLSLTFSVAAAKEMTTRFSEKVASSDFSPLKKASALSRTLFSTVHGLAYSVLKKSGEFSDVSVIDPEERILLAGKIHEDINGEALPRSDCETLVSFISRIRGNPAREESLRRNIQIRNFGRIIDEYQLRMRKSKLIDFEDMVTIAVRLLKDGCSKELSFDFIQADEAQDLTSEQFEFVRLLAPSGNIFAVADDDQSIYGFRGADPGCLKAFTESCPKCSKYILSENHRCAPCIVNLSSKIISANTERLEKTLRSVGEKEGEVNLLHVRDSHALGRFIASDIRPDETTGILYRNNRSAFAVAVALIEAGIPFTVNDEIYAGISRYTDIFMTDCVAKGLTPRELLKKYGVAYYRNVFLKSNTMYRKDADSIKLALDLIIVLSKQEKTLYGFQERLGLLMRAAEEKGYFTEKERPRVFLSTIHSSKGLEYDNVYLIFVNKDEFPGKSSTEGRLLEEERRLFYVGITRAKSRLNIIYSENYAGFPAEESILFREAVKAQTALRRNSRRGQAAQFPEDG